MGNRKKVFIVEKLTINPWIFSTVVLGILILIFILVTSFSGVSGKKAAENFQNFVENQGGSIKIVSINHYNSDAYQIEYSLQGQTGKILVSLDGKYILQQLIIPSKNEGSSSISNQNTNKDVPKTDKPKVELFIMSYCPYGTQSEKGIIPAIEVLGDKIDFKLRFVYYAMHPTSGEVQENLNQYCIQKNEKNKLLPYLKCFLDKGDGETCLTEMGIDKTTLATCVETTNKKFDIIKNLEDKNSWLNGRFPLFNIDKELNVKYGIQGSPTLIINGKQISSSRNSADFLKIMCQAFNIAPKECDASLSNKVYSPGFGYLPSVSSDSDAQCS